MPAKTKTDTSRKRLESKHRSFRLSEKKPLRRSIKLHSPWILLKFSFGTVYKHKRVFACFVAVYGLLQFCLSYVFATSVDLVGAKDQIHEFLGGQASASSVALGLTSFLASSVQSRSNEVVGVYQNLLTIFFLLALVWTIRELFAGNKVIFRQIFYKSQYPFSQFLGTIILFALSMLPITLASFLYNVMFTGGLAVTGLEQTVWGVLCFLLIILSFQFAVPGIIALYIVTLPEISPITAYASAWNLLEQNRLRVMLRILIGYMAILAAGVCMMMFSSYFLTSVSELIFYMVTFLGIILLNIYTYKIYRDLL